MDSEDWTTLKLVVLFGLVILALVVLFYLQLLDPLGAKDDSHLARPQNSAKPMRF
jgi:hypothetical protein